MASRRRGGRGSGTFSTSDTTPAQGVPAPPAVQQALADMGAQLRDFAEEVRELKTLVRQLGGTLPNPGSSATTDQIDVAALRRMQRKRTIILCGAFAAAPMMLLALWVVSADRRHGGPRPMSRNVIDASRLAPPDPPFSPLPPRPARAPNLPLETMRPATAGPGAAKVPPSVSPREGDADSTSAAAAPPIRKSNPHAPVRRARGRPESPAPGSLPRPLRADPEERSHLATRPPGPFARSVHETSGGAPILD